MGSFLSAFVNKKKCIFLLTFSAGRFMEQQMKHAIVSVVYQKNVTLSPLAETTLSFRSDQFNIIELSQRKSSVSQQPSLRYLECKSFCVKNHSDTRKKHAFLQVVYQKM